MDAALETIGARCSCCNKQDFLPFKCGHCALAFCLDHARQEAHLCAALNRPTGQGHGGTAHQSTGPSLKALQAEHLARRRPLIPKAADSAPVQAKQEAAERIQGALKSLKSRFATPKTAAASKIADNARRLGALKREAKGDAKVAVEQRRFLHLAGPSRTLPRFVSKGWTCGRMLDDLAKALDLVNENARTTDPARRLHLLLVEEDLVLEPSQLVEQRLKTDGLTMRIFRGARPLEMLT